MTNIYEIHSTKSELDGVQVYLVGAGANFSPMPGSQWIIERVDGQHFPLSSHTFLGNRVLNKCMLLTESCIRPISS